MLGDLTRGGTRTAAGRRPDRARRHAAGAAVRPRCGGLGADSNRGAWLRRHLGVLVQTAAFLAGALVLAPSARAA